MKLSNEEIRSIVARAEPVLERIDKNHRGDDITDSAANVESNLKELYQAGNGITFESRFSTIVENPSQLSEFLSYKFSNEPSLPEWAERVQQSVSEMADRYVSPLELPEEISSVPFGSLLYPFADFLTDSQEIQELLQKDIFSDSIQLHIQQALIGRLSWLTAQVQHLEFRVYKNQNDVDPSDISPDSTKLFSAFKDHMLNDRFSEMLNRYPMAARYIGMTLVHWENNTIEVLSRVAKDTDQIKKFFEIPRDAKVVGISSGSGDYHNRGRAVRRIKFDSGETIYYKPRDSRLELVYNKICEHISSHSDFEYDLAKIPILSMENYGYVGELSAKPVNQSADTANDALKRYHRRAGYLLCVAYITDTTDLHHENLLAVGEHPMIIDCETIFTRSITQEYIRDSHAHQQLMSTFVTDSVLNTGMLPYVTYEERGQSYGRSGLAQTEPFKSRNRTVNWRQTNTDAMEYEVSYEEVSPKLNTPIADNRRIHPKEYLDELIQGFEVAYNHFNTLEDPIEAMFEGIDLEGLTIRYLLRDTTMYSGTLQAMVSPSRMRSAAASFIATERLVRDTGKLSDVGFSTLSALFEAESTALHRLDIPKFNITRTDAVESDTLVHHSLFNQTSKALLEENIAKMSTEDKLRQIQIIQSTISGSAKPAVES